MHYKIFLSSPSDVDAERDAFQRVVEMINGNYAERPPFELVRWEDQYYTADSTFQDQILKPSDCELVFCIFWKRLGSDLPDAYQRVDGTIPTGSEYEFEEALQGAETSEDKLPDILVYRKTQDVTFSEANLEFEKAQRDRFLHFWRRWFHNEKGHFVAAFHTFTDTDEFEHLVEAHLLQWLQNRSENITWTHGSAFRGLEPFDVEHAPIFFGRQRETERARARLLTNCLNGERFMLIVGASGSGKSSLVRAGLIPRLAIPGGLSSVAQHLRWAVTTPLSIKLDWAVGLSQVFFSDTALASELREGDFDTAERLGALLRRGGAEAVAPVARALERAASREDGQAPGAAGGTVALLLLIDQLEEIFAWPPDDAKGFLDMLAAVVANEPQPILVIATMRSDFQHKLHELPVLERLAGKMELRGPDQLERTLDIGRPSPADLREMIVGPAQAAGLSFEVGEDRMRDLQQLLEVEANPTALPAVQFLLTELYERRRENMLTLEAFDALGGTGGVMATRGEEVLAALGEGPRSAFPRVARALVTQTDSDTPATAQLVPEANFGDEGPEATLVAALTDAGLLMSDRGQVRIAHETLLTGWSRLNRLIEQERQLFEARDRLLPYFRRFQAASNVPRAERQKLLLTGFPLAEGQELLTQWGAASLADTEPELPAFIIASIRREKWLRRRNYMIGWSVAAIFAVIAFQMYSFWMRAEIAKRESDAALLVVESQRALGDGDTTAALDFGMRSYDTLENAKTRSAALEAVMELSPHLHAIRPAKAATLTWLDESQVVLVSEDGTLQLQPQAEPSQPGASRQIALAQQSNKLIVSAERLPGHGLILVFDDGLLARVSTQGSEWQTEVAKLNPPEPLSLEPNSTAIATTSDWLLLATAGFEHVTVFRCTASRKPFTCDEDKMDRIPVPADSVAVALDKSARWLAVAGPGETSAGQLSIYDLSKIGEERTVAVANATIDGDPISLSWSSHGNLVAAGTRAGKIVVLDALDIKRNRLPIFDDWRASDKPVNRLVWSPAKRTLAFQCNTFELCVRRFLSRESDSEVSPPRIEHRYSGHTNTITRLAWSPNGSRLGSLSDNDKLAIWRTDPDQLGGYVLKATQRVSFQSIAVDRTRQRIAAGDEIGNVWLWTGLDPEIEPKRLTSPTRVEAPVVSVSYAPDGALAAVYGDAGVGIWNADGVLERYESLEGGVKRLAWVENGKAIAVPRGDRTVSIIPPSGPFRNLPGIPGDKTPTSVAATTATAIVVNYADGSIQRLSLEGDKPPEMIVTSELAGKNALGAGSLSIDPTGRWLAATRSDNAVVLYDLQKQLPQRRLDIESHDTKAVAFAPSGNRLATLSSDGQLYVWSVDPETTQRLFTIPAAPRRSVAIKSGFHPRPAAWIAWWDDTKLLVATPDSAIQIINLKETQWRERAKHFRR